MKSINKKAQAVLGAICLISLAGCSEKLEPEFSGNLLGNKITMEYNGDTYTRQDTCTPWPEMTANPPTATKALAPVTFSGLQTAHPGSLMDFAYLSMHILVIGFWEQTESFDRQNFVINWGDGTSSEIGYSQKFSWKYNRKKKYDEPDMQCRHWLDGKEISGIKPLDSDCLTIVK